MKKLLALVLALVMAMALAACGAKPAPAPAGDKGNEPAKGDSITIGVSLPTKEQVFWNIMEENLRANASDMGIELIVTDGKLSIDAQFSQVQDFITQGVDAIILCPSSTAGAEAATDLAKEKNIPLFCLNIKADGGYESFVGTDNALGGVQAAGYAAKVLGETGKCAIITYDEIEVCVDRAEGFKEELAKYPNMEVVGEGNYSGDTNKAASVTQDFITQFGDELDLIFAVGDPAAVGAVETIKAANADIKVIGFDGNPEAVEGIKADPDVWIADIAQDPQGQTRTMLEVIQKSLEGTKSEQEILTPPYVLDLEYIEKNGL